MFLVYFKGRVLKTEKSCGYLQVEDNKEVKNNSGKCLVFLYLQKIWGIKK